MGSQELFAWVVRIIGVSHWWASEHFYYHTLAVQGMATSSEGRSTEEFADIF
jgi:hypothetical protein